MPTKADEEKVDLRGEADAMLAAMFGECSMCGHGPGCDKDCDGFDQWVPKHDASPESLELLKALRLADKYKLAKAVKMVIANTACEAVAKAQPAPLPRSMTYTMHFRANMRVAIRCLVLSVFHAAHAICPTEWTSHERWGI